MSVAHEKESAPTSLSISCWLITCQPFWQVGQLPILAGRVDRDEHQRLKSDQSFRGSVFFFTRMIAKSDHGSMIMSQPVVWHHAHFAMFTTCCAIFTLYIGALVFFDCEYNNNNKKNVYFRQKRWRDKRKKVQQQLSQAPSSQTCVIEQRLHVTLSSVTSPIEDFRVKWGSSFPSWCRRNTFFKISSCFLLLSATQDGTHKTSINDAQIEDKSHGVS